MSISLGNEKVFLLRKLLQTNILKASSKATHFPGLISENPRSLGGRLLTPPTRWLPCGVGRSGGRWRVGSAGVKGMRRERKR